MSDDSNGNKILLAIALVAVVVSALGVGFTYYTVVGFQAWLTGMATDTATANLSIPTSEQINFTTDNINWGSGLVSSGATNATLMTDGTNNTNGNWTNITTGFILENIGNVNVTLNLSANNDASSFIGGTSPLYQYNVTNVESNSCLNSSGGTGGLNLGVYTDANTTSKEICGIFQYIDSADTIRIDLKVVVPNDAVGTKGSIITATANPV